MRNRLLMILFIAVFISCKNGDKQGERFSESVSDSNTELDKLDGNWELIRVNDTIFSIEKVYAINYGGQPKITIDTNNNKIGGFTGCNAWGTTFNIQNKSLVLNDPIDMHEQACGGTWEPKFLNFIRNNQSFSIQEEHLVLTSKDNKTMTFQRVD